MEMSKITEVYRKLFSVSFRMHIMQVRARLHLIPAENQHLRELKKGKYMDAHREECEYMLKNGRRLVFPYPWIREHRARSIKVCFDREKHMPYVVVGDKRLYFPHSFSKEEVRIYFNSILIEQDPRSPHYYFNSSDGKLRNSTFLDIGGAEGYITLMVVPFVKKAVIFECDEKWIEALNATFEPYQDKVKIINQFVGAETSGKIVKLDDIVKDRDNVVLKIDVEGMEKDVLTGAAEILDRLDTKVFVCAYHKQDDERELTKMLKEHGFRIQLSDGWMYFYYVDGDAGFRRGIIRAEKERHG